MNEKTLRARLTQQQTRSSGGRRKLPHQRKQMERLGSVQAQTIKCTALGTVPCAKKGRAFHVSRRRLLFQRVLEYWCAAYLRSERALDKVAHPPTLGHYWSGRFRELRFTKRRSLKQPRADLENATSGLDSSRSSTGSTQRLREDPPKKKRRFSSLSTTSARKNKKKY